MNDLEVNLSFKNVRRLIETLIDGKTKITQFHQVALTVRNFTILNSPLFRTVLILSMLPPKLFQLPFILLLMIGYLSFLILKLGSSMIQVINYNSLAYMMLRCQYSV